MEVVMALKYLRSRAKTPLTRKLPAPSRKSHAKSGAYYKAWQKMLTFNI